MKYIEEFNKSYCVKISMYECKYYELKEMADNLDVSLKKLANKSIKLALVDYEKNKVIKCCNEIRIIDDEQLKKYSFKIKEKYYELLKEISDLYDIKIKELVRNIIMYYPTIIKKREEESFKIIAD